MTIHSIAEAVYRHARTQPDRLCLADDGGQVTYFEYTRLIGRFASCFAGMGIAAGSAVVVEACQTIEYLASQLALQLLGAVFVPVEHNCALDKIASFAARVSAAAVVSCRPGDFGPCRAVTWEELSARAAGADVFEPNAFPVNDETRNLIIDTTNESVAQTLNAYKATNNMSYKVKLNGEFYDQTTAIGNVAAPAGADKWATYNVGGQQVDAAYKGIVIVGGKKMVK